MPDHAYLSDPKWTILSMVRAWEWWPVRRNRSWCVSLMPPSVTLCGCDGHTSSYLYKPCLMHSCNLIALLLSLPLSTTTAPLKVSVMIVVFWTFSLILLLILWTMFLCWFPQFLFLFRLFLPCFFIISRNGLTRYRARPTRDQALTTPHRSGH